MARVLAKNKQNLKYSLLYAEEEEYATYKEEDGTEYTAPTGNTVLVYNETVDFTGNISMTGNDTEALAFGIDTSEYDAILVMPINALPIDETSLIWYKSEPTTNSSGYIDTKSADFRVVRIISSLNYTKYVLKGITH